MTAQFPIYERGALAIRRTQIVAVGTATDILNLCKGPNTRVIDLKGRVVIPGLMDWHCHSECLGNNLKYGMDLTPAMSAEEIADVVGRFVREKRRRGQGDRCRPAVRS